MARRTGEGGSGSLADAMVEREHWKDVAEWTRLPGPSHEDVWNLAWARCAQPSLHDWRMWVTWERPEPVYATRRALEAQVCHEEVP
mgnify:CR=1 FL=1